eukprot:GILI01011581.1.p1 GENE.GILI01011581.1~~GILI01011581.1.p1  ORF type:complete len:406 (-),score=114.49 GILI01011581.1:271-1488(-)
MGEQFEFIVYPPEMRKSEGKLGLSFWVYKISAVVPLPNYSRKHFDVMRRYSDFEWLRNQFSEEYPYCIIPPIPEKDMQGTIDKIKGGQNADTKLLEYRQRALRKFLVRVGAHPHLHNSRLLQDFLEMEEKDWELHMKAARKPQPDQHIASAFETALTRQWYPTPAAENAGASYAKALQDPPASVQVWEETKEYINRLHISLGVLRERLTQLIRRRREASIALHEFGRCFTRVGEVEGSLEQTPLSNAILAVSNHTEQLSKVYVDHADQESKNVEETLTYYILMCNAVRDTIQRLLAFMQARDQLLHQTEELKSQREKLMSKGGQPDKVAKVEADLQSTTEKKDLAISNVKKMELLVKDELRKFHHDKQFDVKGILKVFAELQMDYAAKMRRSWEGLAPTVENIKA